jgi:hypothetical protein
MLLKQVAALFSLIQVTTMFGHHQQIPELSCLACLVLKVVVPVVTDLKQVEHLEQFQPGHCISTLAVKDPQAITQPVVSTEVALLVKVTTMKAPAEERQILEAQPY